MIALDAVWAYNSSSHLTKSGVDVSQPTMVEVLSS